MTIDTVLQPTARTDIDPRRLFATAVAVGGDVVDAVRPHQLSDPTPCAEMDVRALLGHLVGVLERVAVIGDGEDAFAGPSLEVAVDVADGAWSQAWAAGARRAHAAWADDVALTRMVRLPWAEMSGAATLVMYLNEVTVHTWDLAQATGQQPSWDLWVLEAALDGMRRSLPAEGRAEVFEAVRRQVREQHRSFADPYAEAVPVPADAPLIDRLVGWNGRRP